MAQGEADVDRSRRDLCGQCGQTSAEYLGVIVVVAAILAAIFVAGIPGQLAGAIENAICQAAGDCPAGPPGSDGPASPPVDPQLTADERNALTSDDPQDAQDVLASLSPEELAWLEQNDPDAFAAANEARSWGEQRDTVDQYATGDLDEFLDYKDSGEQDGRLDFTDDGCSNVPDSGPYFDFKDACERHDFGYRNYKELGLFDEEKDSVDDQFLQDMKDHCATRGLLAKGPCYAQAEAYHQGVEELGGTCEPLGGPRVIGPCAPENG